MVLAKLLVVVAVVATTSGAAADEPLPFQFQNGRDSGGLVYTVRAAAHGATRWARSMRIAIEGDVAQSTRGLRVVEPIVLESDAGETVEVHASSPAVEKLVPGAYLSIEAEGSFGSSGVYRGEVVLLQGMRHRVVPLRVTVEAATRGPLPVKEHGGSAIALTEGFVGGATPVLPLRLQNTGDDSIEIVALFAGASRLDRVDSPQYQIAISGADATSTTHSIGPRTVERFDLPITGVDSAGIYSFETLLSDGHEEYQPWVAKTTVYIRESPGRAALAILIGALLTWFIRRQVTDGDNRLTLRRRIGLLAERVRAFRGGAPADDLVTAARVLELDIEDRQRDARWGGKIQEIEPVIKRAEIRLVLLEDIASAVTQLNKIDLDKQLSARTTIDSAVALVRVDPGDESKLTTARESVANLSLIALRREQLRKHLVDLRTQIEYQRRASPTPALLAALNAATGKLAEAEEFARLDRLDDLEARLGAGRRELLDASIADLRERIAGAPPPGTEATWPRDSAAITVELDTALAYDNWSARNAALQSAQRLFITAAVQGLASRATARAGDGDSRATELKRIAAELTSALSTNVLEAGALYSQHLAFVTAPDPKGIQVGLVSRQTDGARDAGAEARSGWVPLLLTAVEGLPSRRIPTEVVHVDRLIRSSRWIVNVGVLVIAVATGLKVLWLDDLSWGGHSAWLIAFLWGAGVQATGDAFAGVVSLRGKLGGLPSVP